MSTSINDPSTTSSSSSSSGEVSLIMPSRTPAPMSRSITSILNAVTVPNKTNIPPSTLVPSKTDPIATLNPSPPSITTCTIPASVEFYDDDEGETEPGLEGQPHPSSTSTSTSTSDKSIADIISHVDPPSTSSLERELRAAQYQIGELKKLLQSYDEDVRSHTHAHAHAHMHMHIYTPSTATASTPSSHTSFLSPTPSPHHVSPLTQHTPPRTPAPITSTSTPAPASSSQTHDQWVPQHTNPNIGWVMDAQLPPPEFAISTTDSTTLRSLFDSMCRSWSTSLLLCPSNTTNQSIPPWQADASAPNCNLCRSEFVFLLRPRHHCRLCGLIFCSTCVREWSGIPLHMIPLQRMRQIKGNLVCLQCFVVLQHMLPAPVPKLPPKRTTPDVATPRRISASTSASTLTSTSTSTSISASASTSLLSPPNTATAPASRSNSNATSDPTTSTTSTPTTTTTTIFPSLDDMTEENIDDELRDLADSDDDVDVDDDDDDVESHEEWYIIDAVWLQSWLAYTARRGTPTSTLQSTSTLQRSASPMPEENDDTTTLSPSTSRIPTRISSLRPPLHPRGRSPSRSSMDDDDTRTRSASIESDTSDVSLASSPSFHIPTRSTRSLSIDSSTSISNYITPRCIPPGPITNSRLLIDGTNIPRQDLLLGLDYRVVSRIMWHALVNENGGGPEIRRTQPCIYPMDDKDGTASPPITKRTGSRTRIRPSASPITTSTPPSRRRGRMSASPSIASASSSSIGPTPNVVDLAPPVSKLQVAAGAYSTTMSPHMHVHTHFHAHDTPELSLDGGSSVTTETITRTPPTSSSSSRTTSTPSSSSRASGKTSVSRSRSSRSQSRSRIPLPSSPSLPTTMSSSAHLP